LLQVFEATSNKRVLEKSLEGFEMFAKVASRPQQYIPKPLATQTPTTQPLTPQPLTPAP
jgi:hypothetical protein